MKTSRNLKVSTVTTTLVASSLIAVIVVAGWPGRILATSGAPQAIEVVSTEQTLALTSAADGTVIDHNCVDADTIPQAWLDQARDLVTFFNHKSIGTNILEGIADLQSQNPARYTISVQSSSGTGSGINHYQAGSNGQPLSKINGFSPLVKDGHDAGMMKFCTGDVPCVSGDTPIETMWTEYRDAMVSLTAAHPDTTIVWWTIPIIANNHSRAYCNEEMAWFNDNVRAYVQQHGGVLFDIADIESHDPDGNPVTWNGIEAGWPDYTADGAHLNETGRQRVASAMWWLLARLAGWGDTTAWISVTAANPVASTYPGETATYALSVTASEGFSDPVTLALQGEPSGATVSFDHNPVTPPGTSQLSITTAASTPAGNYAMTVTGTSGQVDDTTSLTLTVNPTFALTAQPDAHTILPGDTAVYTLSLTAGEGFAAPVDLTLQGEPSGATASFDPNPVTPPGTSQLHVTTTASAAPGIYAMAVSGTSGVLTDTANLTLIVASAAPSFTLSISPTTRIARPNQVVSYTVVAAGVNGFSQPVSLTVVGLPTGVDAGWSVNPVTPGDSSILTLSIPGSPSFGNRLLQVVGTADMGTADMQVVAEGFELTITYITYPFSIYLPIILKQVQCDCP